MICVLCKKAVVRPPVCCDKCGRMVCGKCRKGETGKSTLGIRSRRPWVRRETIYTCKFCLAEVELST